MSAAPQLLTPSDGGGALPLVPLSRDGFRAWAETASGPHRAWAEANGFVGGDGAGTLLIPDADGRVSGALVGIAGDANGTGADAAVWALAGLSETLPYARPWRLDPPPGDGDRAADWALGWLLGAYAYDRHKARKRPSAQLVAPPGVDAARLAALAAAQHQARDLINTPALELTPAALAAEVDAVAALFGATVRHVVGDTLLAENYPAIHLVGRAASCPPRLIDLRWGTAGPKITLVGKGVCFDSGGLNLKPSSAMKLMKKDMGGAAAALAVARMAMACGLNIRLRLLIPAVENAVGGNAFHPLDVVKTRKGLTVEVGDTDAEGRLILADALTEADAEAPDLLIDFATLTGAARTALGPDLPALFARRDGAAEALLRCGAATGEPMWRLPLWKPYRRMLDCKGADLSSTGDSPMAGAITAALFLSEFVGPRTDWVHFDIYGWNPRARPGRPEGGDVQCVRAVLRLIEARAATA